MSNTTHEVAADATVDRDWATLLACAAGLMLSVGAVTIYPLGIFIGPLQKEFGWTRGQISGAATVGQISLVVSSLLWGQLLDRFGPRRTLLSSVFGLSIGLLLFSRLSGPLWHLDVLFALVPLLAAAANPLGYNSVLVRRFSKKLGLALGVALMGVGLGAALLPALAQRIITMAGWRLAYMTLAAMGACRGSACCVGGEPPRAQPGPASGSRCSDPFIATSANARLS